MTKPNRELAPCGTYAAAMRHKNRREPLDDACREACRLYTQNRRANRPGAREYDRWVQHTYDRALRELADSNRSQFLTILDRIRGSDPPPALPPMPTQPTETSTPCPNPATLSASPPACPVPPAPTG